MSDYSNEPMLDMFVFETEQLLEQLEQLVIESEKSDSISQDTINEIFRIMHTIKGSSAMMSFNDISAVAHAAEDLFFILRESGSGQGSDNNSIDFIKISDMVLESIDFIKSEIEKITNGETTEQDPSPLIERIRNYVKQIKKLHNVQNDGKTDKCLTGEADGDQTDMGDIAKSEAAASGKTDILSEAKKFSKRFKAVICFEDNCEMESMRSYMLSHSLQDIAAEIRHIPEDICDNSNDDIIRREGFQVWFSTDHTYEEMYNFFSQTIFLKSIELIEIDDNSGCYPAAANIQIRKANSGTSSDSVQMNKKTHDNNLTHDNRSPASHHSIISVNVTKLDKLMDLVGELVISESMVTQNPDLAGLTLDRFQKAAGQHRKIIGELQDIAMSIRMVPLSATFQKMNRIIRDMSRKLNKDVRLEIKGEETEVDKNIIEHISDPLMHLIRNAIDHGLELPEERRAKGKPEAGMVRLKAKNAGGDVMITVKDDGRGLNKEKILARARANGLVNREENDISDREIYSYIFHPGLSTNDKATEFSGRGVGMDVVAKNIGAVGGVVSVDSNPDEGTVVTIKIPLTLAIMDGMIIKVGKSKYTIPMISIKESFKVKKGDVITDPDENEMIMIRGECYPILRLHEVYKVETEITKIHDGIIVMVEHQDKAVCLLADELAGVQQVVVKALPEYIKNMKRVRGLEGCTLLGDGSISLILDIAGLLDK